MKMAFSLAVAIAATSLNVDVNAAPVRNASMSFQGDVTSRGDVTPQGDVQLAGLAWRCGKKNPAEWGTFGNGCLKQKRKARQGKA
ncbi:hypothetical protein [Methylosinus sporium]|uniref:Uncharacterized protein n=1 Tax=Methylosinus sporium TaxID=428 RepID=A0A2U1SW41_METSR|nr:hypothetical protein [Methylosinus sporium]PWB95841.1 hypothetical protein C5689_01730 [Methylosinus sporium]